MESRSTESLSGVIFDLDGTLYGDRWLKPRMTLALWGDLKPLRHLGKTRSTLRAKSFDSSVRFKRALYEELARRTGITAEKAADWYENAFMEKFVAVLAKHGRTRPGLLPLLDFLRKNGTKLAVVSDYGRVGERLAALGIPEDAFDDILSVEDFGVLKPCAEPLDMLASKWKIDPARAAVVGDREDLDRASAEAAGMQFIGVDKRRILIRKRNGFICWSEVTKLLRIKSGPAS